MSNLDKLAPLKAPSESAAEVAAREKRSRRGLGMSQADLAARSGVSLGSLRRFEQTGQISFESLVRIMRALRCEGDLDGLFSRPTYRSIDDVIADRRRYLGKGGRR